MFKSFIKTYEIAFAQKVNMWIYFIRRVPFVGKKIPESLYSEAKAKVIIANIIRVLSFLGGFVRKFIYILMTCILPASLISLKVKNDIPYLGFHIFFFLSFVMGPLFNNIFTSNIQQNFYMIGLMRVNPKNYFLGQIIFSAIENFIYFIFPIMIFHCNFIESVIISIEFVAVRFITQALFLLIENTKGKQTTNRWWRYVLVIISLLALLGCAYGLPFINIVLDAKNIIISIPYISISLVLSVISIVYLFKSKKYTAIANAVVSKSDLNVLDSLESDFTFASVKLDDKKINKEDLKNDRFKNKHGIDYLNIKFLQRHKKIIINPIKTRVILISIICILFVIIAIFLKQSHEKLNSFIISSGGVMVFILYMISVGEKITKAFFFNCDNSLLRYKFYKEPKIILDNFKSRLKITVILNLIPAVTLALGLLAVLVFTKGDIIRYIPILISILTLSCFFSVHYLFLYYIVQPYTAQLTIKSPIYSFVSSVIWIIAYTCLQFKNATILFTIGVIFATVIYTVIALMVTYKFAPTRFKLH